MINFVCIPPSSRITLMVAIETVHFLIVHLSLSLGTFLFFIFGVPVNDVASMKISWECKLGQLSSRCVMYSLELHMQTLS